MATDEQARREQKRILVSESFGSIFQRQGMALYSVAALLAVSAGVILSSIRFCSAFLFRADPGAKGAQMEKVLFINGQKQLVADILQAMAPDGFAVRCISSSAPEEEKLKEVEDAHYLVLHPAVASGEMVRKGASLRLVQLLTAGYDRVDVQTAAGLGVPVATNGGANAVSVAEHALSLMLAIYRRLVACNNSVRGGSWRKAADGFNTFELSGKTIGVVGAGNIGSRVAARAKAFDARIVYHDARTNDALESTLNAQRVSLDDLVHESDIITLHAPLIDATRGMIGEREIAAMKPGAILINTSRAELVDENALISALRDNRIAGAGLDVFWQEPVPVDHPLLSFDNVVLTPHIAGHSLEGWTRRSRTAWENIQKVSSGKIADFLVH